MRRRWPRCCWRQHGRGRGRGRCAVRARAPGPSLLRGEAGGRRGRPARGPGRGDAVGKGVAGLAARLHCGLGSGPRGRRGHRLRPGAVRVSRAPGPLSCLHWNVMTGVGGPSMWARRGSRSACRLSGTARPGAALEAASRTPALWLRGPPRPGPPLPRPAESGRTANEPLTQFGLEPGGLP